MDEKEFEIALMRMSHVDLVDIILADKVIMERKDAEIKRLGQMVDDLSDENDRLKEEIGEWKRAYARAVVQNSKLHRDVKLLKNFIKETLDAISPV